MLPSIFGEDLFDDFFTDPFEMMPVLRGGRDLLYGKHGRNVMKTDVKELDNGYQLSVDLPGFQKENVSVELNNGYLTINASKNLDKDEEEGGRYIRRERYSGSCSRSFYVGDVRQEDISAKFENGILKLTMPKTARQELPRRNIIAIE